MLGATAPSDFVPDGISIALLLLYQYFSRAFKFMVSLATFAIPLLAIWLWWPLNRMSLRARIISSLLTAMLGVIPAMLLQLLQTGAVPYIHIAPWQVPGGWILAILLMLAIFVVMRDLLWLIAQLTGRKGMAQIMHIPALSIGALLVAASLSAIGVFNALQPPRVHEQHLVVRNLPHTLQGLRIAVLADIHASPVNDASYVNTIVERTMGAVPDLIVLPGDMVDGDVASGRANVAPLARLSARYGVWAAPGNHEYYSGYNSWMSEFRRLGLNLLENRMQVIHIKGTKLALSGIGDPVYGRTSPNNANPGMPEGIPPDVDAVVTQARKAGAQFHVLLAHQPKFARDNATKGVNLQISGHTHGGLITGLDQWVVAPVNNGFVRGEYEIGNMKLFVSSGAGLWAGFAVRLGVAPRIELLTLTAEE